jgi:hypothetical protein
MSMDKYQYEEWCNAGKPVTGPARLARDEETCIRNVVAPLLEQAIGKVVMPMIAESEARLRREFRSLARRARLRRWSKKDADRFAEEYVQRLPKVEDVK